MDAAHRSRNLNNVASVYVSDLIKCEYNYIKCVGCVESLFLDISHLNINLTMQERER